MTYQFTLKQILNIAAKNLHKSVVELNRLQQQQYADTLVRDLNTDLRIMMKRIRWHLLQLEPGPSSYVVTN